MFVRLASAHRRVFGRRAYGRQVFVRQVSAHRRVFARRVSSDCRESATARRCL